MNEYSCKLYVCVCVYAYSTRITNFYDKDNYNNYNFFSSKKNDTGHKETYNMRCIYVRTYF